MTDEQTAAQLVSFGQCSTDAEFEAAIVRALQAARKEGGKQVVDEAERVSQILQSANTANADNESKARFEVDRFAFACAGSVVGSTLTDYQKHALFHQFKNMFDSHESALQSALTPPPGHIIDDAGVVRKVYCKTPRYGFWQLDEQDGVKVVDVMQQEFTKPQREAAEAAKEGKA